MSAPIMAFSRRSGAASDRSPGAGVSAQLPLIGGFLLLLAVAAASVWLLVNSYRFNEAVAHTLQVRNDAYHVLTLVQDAESGQRGYLLTGNQEYLRPYSAGATEAPRAVDKLKILVLGNKTQGASVARLGTLITAKLAELAQTVVLRKNGDRDGALKIVNDNSGNGYMESIRTTIGQIEDEEERFQRGQRESVQFNNLLLAVASLIGIGLVFTLAGYAILTATRANRGLVKAQEALRDTNENLEGLVAARVAELQLANEEIQRFAYIVSHDLRAPLVNVMGFTSELDAARGEIATFLKAVEVEAPHLVTTDRRLAVETDLPEALGFIRTSTAKMDRLINAILKLSREGRRVLTPQKIELSALIAAQGDVLSQQLSAGAAELDVQPDLPDIVSDRLAIEQIFGNLIENAIKYLAPGRPGKIAVTGKAHGTYLRYDVVDNGRGIAAKDFERVFELFRRSGEQDQPGEGIGLAYVRNLARRLGGNVTVQSQLGTGSTFTVTLPSVYSSKARVK